jgi:hypothetical protein
VLRALLRWHSSISFRACFGGDDGNRSNELLH